MDEITTINHHQQSKDAFSMKSQTLMRTPFFAGLVLALAMGTPGQASAAEPADGKVMTDASMMTSCHDIQAQKLRLDQDIKNQDAALADQCVKMNSAPEDQKAAMMLILVTNLVEQKCTMDARKSDMEDAMMKHAMLHMQMGKESMQGCPMMKGMKEMDAKAGDDSKPHH